MTYATIYVEKPYSRIPMCLALIAKGQHPEYPLIILSNRDEFYNRATLPAHFWSEYPDIFSGKDLTAGGSWLGVNKSGHFSLVTNFRTPDLYKTSKQSRGLLVKNFLQDNGHTLPSDYMKEIAACSGTWNPFNLIIGNMSEMVYHSNVSKQIIPLASNKLYAISNHLLDTPWYKVLKAKNLFDKLLNELASYDNPIVIRDRLSTILEDKTPSPDNLLPATGVPQEMEKSLGSIFVDIPDYQYGTRSSTIILIKTNEIFFSEKTFMNGKTISLHHQLIKIDYTYRRG